MDNDIISVGYQAAKISAAWSDNRQFGVLLVSGKDRLDFLNRMSTTRLDNLEARQTRQSVIVNEKGRVIDLVSVLATPDEALLLTAFDKRREVTAWLKKYIIMDDVKIKDITERYRFIEILGPAAINAVRRITGDDDFNLTIKQWLPIKINNDEFIAFRAQAIAETSYFFMAPVDVENDMFQTYMDLPKASADDYNVLRVEAGQPAAGKELTEDFNPLEAGLLHLIDFKKGCYLGQEVIARVDSYNKVQKRIMGFASALPIEEGAIITFDGADSGRVTSAARSPEYGYIALGYIRGESASAGALVQLNGGVEARISNLPFAREFV